MDSEFLKKNFGNIKKIFSNLSETNYYQILNSIENDNKSIALLVGEVQSGKTNAILNLIKEAIEKFNYDTIFFLSGINNNLKLQSTNRLSSFFKEQNNIITTDDIDYYLSNEYKKSYNYVLSILKEDDNLDKICNLVYNESFYFKNKKVLIIDDESDYASINTNTKEVKSKINGLIMGVFDSLESANMILVTATPYANILNSKVNSNEVIQKIFTLKSNKGYTGLDYFNSLPNFYETNFKYLDSINTMRGNNDDKSIVYSVLKWLYQTYKFFKENSNEKSTLLIYCSNYKENHEKYVNLVKKIINSFCLYKSIYIELLKSQNEKNINDILLWTEDIIKKYGIKIHCLNSEKQNNDSNITEINQEKLNVVVGGTMLSRGITYENLLVELFLYSSPNVSCDTLLQRCRWFGYRTKNNRDKYMKLITTNEIKDSFFEAQKYNDIMFKNSGNELDVSKTYNELKNTEKLLNLKIINWKKL